MSVRIKASGNLPEMFGTIVGFASPNDPTVLLIENHKGTFTIHDDEVIEFFPNA